MGPAGESGLPPQSSFAISGFGQTHECGKFRNLLDFFLLHGPGQTPENVPLPPEFSENPMALKPEDVKSIAHLARLEIREADIPAYADNLSRIIDFVNQLEKADTDDVTPMAHPLEMSQRLRADEVSEQDQRDKYQQNAPQVEAGLYLVPKVIE